MSINKKIFLLFSSLFILLAFFFYLVLEYREKHLISFENKYVKNKIQALNNILADRLKRLDTLSYGLSIDKKVTNPISKKTNFYQLEHITSNLNISHLIIFNGDKKVLFSESFDVNNKEFLNVPKEDIKTFLEKLDLTLLSKRKGVKFVTLDYEKVIFSIEKIDKNNYIFLGRTLDSEFLTNLSKLLDVYVSLIPSYNFEKKVLKEGIFLYDIQRVDEKTIYSNIEIKDMFDNSNFFFSLRIERTLYEEIRNSNMLLTFLFLFALFILVVVFYIFINKIFTKRILNISDSVKEVSKNKELAFNIQMVYDDEISYLANKINEMFLTINDIQSQKIKKERDFLQSVLDAQQHIIFITDGSNIHSANKKFKDIFKSSNSFLSNLALLDNNTKSSLIKIAKEHSSIEKPARLKINEQEDKYFIFDISKVEFEKYIICMNDVSQVSEKINYLESKATIDQLTSCFNKATIEYYTKYWLKLKDFGLMVLDIDKFKSVNDNYGHLIGDYILKDIAKLIASSLPSSDILGRFGGEEFVILVDDKSNNLENIAQRIRKVVEEYVFKYEDILLKITISIGCTYCKKNGEFTTFFKTADDALYEAKNTGRNKVVLKF